MTQTFAEYAQQDDVALFSYVTISGIPYVFSNIELPAKWAGKLGERSWSHTYDWFGGEGGGGSTTTVSAELDEKNGVAISGSAELLFTIDTEAKSGDWVDLLMPSSRQSWQATSDPVKRSTNVISLVDSTGIAEGDTLHRGTEAIKVTLVSGDDIGGIRGFLGTESDFLNIKRPDGSAAGGPVEFWNVPIVWRGRIIEIWIGQGTPGPNGEILPNASKPFTFADLQRFKGVVSDWSWEPGDAYVKIIAQGLEQLLDQSVISVPKSYKAGPGREAPGGGWIYIEPDGPRYIEYDAGEYFRRRYDTVVGSPPSFYRGQLDLTASGVIPGDPLTSGGLVSTANLIGHIVDALNAVFDASASYFLQFEGFVDDEGKVNFSCREYDSSFGPPKEAFRLLLDPGTALYPALSVLPALGMTEDFEIPAVGGDTYGDGTIQAAPELPPAYVFGPGNTRFYWHGNNRQTNGTVYQDPPYAQGTIPVSTSDSAVDGAGLRLGESEVIAAKFRTSATADIQREAGTDYDDGFFYATVSARGLCGTEESYWIVKAGEVDDAKNEVVLGLAFDDHRLVDIMRWVATSNGDTDWRTSAYNVLPHGYGAAIPAEFFDLPSFDDAGEDTRADGWWIEGTAMTVRELFSKVCVALGMTVLPRVTSEGYRITLVRNQPAPQAVGADFSLDLSWNNPIEAPPAVYRSERDVVNQLEFEYAYDPLEKKWTGAGRDIDAGSMALYGPSAARKIQLPWVQQAGSAVTAMRKAGARIFAEYAHPSAVIEIDVTRNAAWGYGVGHIVSFTHPTLPNIADGAMGISAEPMHVFGAEYQFGPGAAYTARYRLRWRRTLALIRYPYAPNLRVKTDRGGGVYEVETHAFRPAGSLLRDIHSFARAQAEGWPVRSYREGREDDADELQVTGVSIADNEIVFDSELSASIANAIAAGVVVVELADFDTSPLVDTSARYHAFLGDEDTFDITVDSTDYPVGRWV